MQMLDVLKRLAELDADNPRVYKDTPILNNESKDVDEEKAEEGPEILKIKSDQAKAKGEKSFTVGKKTFPVKEGEDEQVEECGMMPTMGGMSNNHTPASINISADSGDELSAMLRDIMTLAGRGHHDHDDMDMAEPAAANPPPAEISTDGGDDMDEPSMMRSMIDRLNPGDDEGGDQDGDQEDDEETESTRVQEYDNEPNPETSGYDSMTPTGNDASSHGDNEASKVNGGGNPYSRTMEQIQQQLFHEYKKFINE